MENTIITISNVHGYIDKNGTVWLNAEDVARGLGFTRIADSGNEVVRWERVNNYLNDFGFMPTSEHAIKAGDFIPENIFYRLAMKAKNETAEKFQAKVADEILPAIRKHGFYSAQPTNVADKEFSLHKLVTDVGKTAEALQKYFDVAKGISLATATTMAEDFLKIDLSLLKKLIPPADHEIGTLNPTQIGEKLGGISARKVNDVLTKNGLQVKDGRDYRLTDEGKKYAEMIPYTNNGHSGYQIRWNPQIVNFFTGNFNLTEGETNVGKSLQMRL